MRVTVPSFLQAGHSAPQQSLSPWLQREVSTGPVHPVDIPSPGAAPQTSLEQVGWGGEMQPVSRLAHAEHTSTAATEGIAGHQGLCVWSPGSVSSLSLTFTPIGSVLGQAPTSSRLNVSSIISGLPASPTCTPSQGWWLQRKRSQMPGPRKSSRTGSLTPTCLKLPQGLAIAYLCSSAPGPHQLPPSLLLFHTSLKSQTVLYVTLAILFTWNASSGST